MHVDEQADGQEEVWGPTWSALHAAVNWCPEQEVLWAKAVHWNVWFWIKGVFMLFCGLSGLEKWTLRVMEDWVMR